MTRIPTLGLALLLVAGALPAQTAKPRVTQPSELPTHSYTVALRPSEAVLNREAVLALAKQVEKALNADLDAFDVQDKASLLSLHSTLYVTGILRQDHPSARHHLEAYRKLLDNPTQRLTTGLLMEPLMQALEAPGTDLHATFRTLLTQRLATLPYEQVAGTLKATLKGQRASSKEQLVGTLAAGLDPAVKGGTLDEDATGTFLVTAMNLHVVLPVRDDVVACLEQVLAAHRDDKTSGTPLKTALGTTQLKAKGAFFGQPLPGETPVRFAPEVLGAVSPWASGVAFSPDGLECFLQVGDANYSSGAMVHSRCVKGEWTPLEEPSFLKGLTHAFEPVFSRDGQTLTFTASVGSGASELWTVQRTATGWGTPVAFPAPVNSSANEFRGSYALDGSFYFGSERVSPGINQVFKATRNGAEGWTVEKLGAPINALSYDGDPCIAPDGRFLIYYAGRSSGYGRVDLYVAFSDGKGGWGTPINLGPKFNGPDDEFGAYFSADGKTLFFNRHTAQGDQSFWVATSAIDKLRP